MTASFIQSQKTPRAEFLTIENDFWDVFAGSLDPARDNDIHKWMIRPMHNSYPLPETGFVRLANVLAPAGPIPV
jgi:hypothetical protein